MNIHYSSNVLVKPVSRFGNTSNRSVLESVKNKLDAWSQSNEGLPVTTTLTEKPDGGLVLNLQTNQPVTDMFKIIRKTNQYLESETPLSAKQGMRSWRSGEKNNRLFTLNNQSIREFMDQNTRNWSNKLDSKLSNQFFKWLDGETIDLFSEKNLEQPIGVFVQVKNPLTEGARAELKNLGLEISSTWLGKILCTGRIKMEDIPKAAPANQITYLEGSVQLYPNSGFRL